MEDYILEYDKLFTKVAKYGIKILASIMVFKLLDDASLPHKDWQLALTGVDFSQKFPPWSDVDCC